MSKIIGKNYYLIVKDKEPELYDAEKVHSEMTDFTIAFVSYMGTLIFVSTILETYLLTNNHNKYAVISLVIAILTMLISTSFFKKYKDKVIQKVDTEDPKEEFIGFNNITFDEIYQKNNIKKPKNLTNDEWDNFIATLLVGKTPTEYGKVWLTDEENKTVSNFLKNNKKIIKQNKKDKELQEKLNEEKAQLKLEAKQAKERIIKHEDYKNNVNDFVEKKMINNVQ